MAKNFDEILTSMLEQLENNPDQDIDVLVKDAENGGYPPTQNGDIRSLFWLFSLMALQN